MRPMQENTVRCLRDPPSRNEIHHPKIKMSTPTKTPTDIIAEAWDAGCENKDQVIGWLAYKAAESMEIISGIKRAVRSDAPAYEQLNAVQDLLPQNKRNPTE